MEEYTLTVLKQYVVEAETVEEAWEKVWKDPDKYETGEDCQEM